MNPVLLSVRAKFATQIMAGTKGYEFRKEMFIPGTRVVVYQCGAPEVRGITGMFTVGEITSGTARFLHGSCPTPGVSLGELTGYATLEPGKQRGLYRMEVTALQAFGELVPLTVIGVSRPPQSWQYTTTGAVQTLQDYVGVPF